jgi:hypothetical protein
MKKFNDFIKENNNFSLPHPNWNNMSSEERSEILFGKQSNLDKQFSKIMIKNLISDDKEQSRKWSTYNAAKIEIDDYDEKYGEELDYRITDGESPVKVITDIIDRIKNPNDELIRLKDKIQQWKFDPK